MPTVGEFHRNYWGRRDSTGTRPVVTHGSGGGYPAWQASVIAPSLLGILGAKLDYWRELVRWWLALYRRIHRLDAERRAVLLLTLDRLEHPAYRYAQQAVRETATTLGFNRPEAWKPLSHAMKASPGHAENTFRHMRSYTVLKDALKADGSTMTNPQLHLTTELAYQGFAWKGK